MKTAGIYPLPRGGFRVVACIGRGAGNRQEKRFPAGTAVRTMTRWQEDACAALRKTGPKIAQGSLLEDLVDRYLPAVKGMPTKKERERHLRLWVTALGAKRTRDTVTPPEIRATLERWRAEHRWENGTCNRARTALMHFYTVLNGKSGANPVKDVAKLRERRRPPRRIDYATFERILAAMPDVGGYETDPVTKKRRRLTTSQTKARLAVIAYTGLPHAQLMALKPEHIRWAERALYVPGRNKGAGTDDRWLPLSRAAVTALAALADAKAFGSFSTSSMRKGFQKAAASIGRPDLTPYDLRHLFGTTVLACSKNRAATRDLMLHTTDTTTARYAAGAIPIELRDAIEAFDREVVAPGCGERTESTAAAAGSVLP